MKNIVAVLTSVFAITIALSLTACTPPETGGGVVKIDDGGGNNGKKKNNDEGGGSDGGTNSDNGHEDRPFTCGRGDVNNFGIVGGDTLDPSSWLAMSTVYLVQDVHVYEDGTRSGFACTGTLIDRDMVITAGHCVNRVDIQNNKPLYVFFTAQPECAHGNMTSVQMFAAEVKIHPDFGSSSRADNERPHGDVALVRLEKPAILGYQPISFKDDFPNFHSNAMTWLAGYGKTTDYYETDQAPTVLRVTPVKTFDAGAGDWGKFAPSPYEEVIYFDQRENHGACAGDSGGPALFKFNGRFYQIGIASVVADPNANSETDAKPCHTMSAYTNLYYYKAWLEEQFASMKGPFSKKTRLFE